MKRKHETDLLKEIIVSLEIKRAKELNLLKDQIHLTYESLKPINLVRKTVHEVTSSPEIKNDMLDNIIGLTTGYLSKRVLFGASKNLVKNIVGTLFQFAVANVVSKHSGSIKSTGGNLLHLIFNRNQKEENIYRNGSSE